MSTSTGASGDVVARRAPGLDLYAPARARRRLEVSPRRARALARVGIETVQDLLEHYPRYHVDRTQLRTVRELGALAAQGHEGEVQVHARGASTDRPRRTRTGRVLIRGRIGDETGSVEVNWFNQEWVARALRPGSWAFFYGRLGVFRGRLQMTAPLLEGEVGSGKTVVALYACLIAVAGGRQAAFMAPTEVLAEQHHLTVSELLDRAFGTQEARNLFAATSRRPVVRRL